MNYAPYQPYFRFCNFMKVLEKVHIIDQNTNIQAQTRFINLLLADKLSCVPLHGAKYE